MYNYKMIRSSTLSINSMNKEKLKAYNDFLVEFHRMFQIMLDDLWDGTEPLQKFLDHKRFNDRIWLSSRIIQITLKQVSALVRGTLISAKRLNKLASKPILNNINPELDQRCVRFDFLNETSFDCWMTLNNLGKRGSNIKIKIPLKSTNHFNKLRSNDMEMTKGCLPHKGATRSL